MNYKKISNDIVNLVNECEDNYSAKEKVENILKILFPIKEESKDIVNLVMVVKTIILLKKKLKIF